MNFFNKLRFWKKRNETLTTRDVATSMDILTSETSTQVSLVEMIVTRQVGSQVDSIVTCEASTQTANRERSKNRSDGGSAEKGKQEMKRKLDAMTKIIEEKDRLIRKQTDTIEEMKERHISRCQYFLRKLTDLREEVNSLKERRSQKKRPAEPSAEQQSLGPSWADVVRGGRVVRAAGPSSSNHATRPVTQTSARNEVTATSRKSRTSK